MLLELSFDWEAVNKELSSDLFTIKGMGVNDKTIVNDLRLGRRVIVGIGNKENAIQPVVEIETSGQWYNYLIAILIIIFAFAAAIIVPSYLWRFRKKPLA